MPQELITYQEVQSLAETFAKSGYFQDARDMAQAVVKIMAGRELGIGPVASMSGVYIVKGKPALSANLLAGVLKKSGRYDYRVAELTDEACEIVYFQNGKEIGRSRFTIQDAKRAGTQNLEKFPRNMLFARAFTNGARWYTPDVFAGGLYTPEELGAETDGETGEVIEAQVEIIKQEAPSEKPNGGNGHKAEEVKAAKPPTLKQCQDRWAQLWAWKTALGFEYSPLPASATVEQYIERGKDLHAALVRASLSVLPPEIAWDASDSTIKAAVDQMGSR